MPAAHSACARSCGVLLPAVERHPLPLPALQSAAAAGISVQQRSLPLAQLQALLLGGSCLLIALVDKVSLLRCEAAEGAAAAAAASGSSWLGGHRRSHRLLSGAAAGVAAAGEHGASGGGGAESVLPAAVRVSAAAAVCSRTEAAAATAAAAAAGSKPGGSASEGYLGHYVVVCGYDAGSDQFEIRDPAGSQ